MSIAASVDDGVLEVGLHFFIDSEVQIKSRTRYNFWTALGDIGGFHDGLTLVIKGIIASIAAISYENDLLKGNLFAELLTPD